jgi:GNAT superfamily N-acetyltransferase
MSMPKMEKALGLKIKLATPNDSLGISEVLCEAFTPYREHYTDEAFHHVTPTPDMIEPRFEEGPIWVAELDGKVAGTVSLTTLPEGLYIRSMAVRPDLQGVGIGHKLLDELDEHARDTTMDRIFLYTTYFVPGARELYEKHGFRWVRDTTAEEWYGTPGLEMDKSLTRK